MLNTSILIILPLILFIYFLVKFIKKDAEKNIIKQKKINYILLKNKISFLLSGFFVIFIICGLFFGWIIGLLISITILFFAYQQKYKNEKEKKAQDQSV